MSDIERDDFSANIQHTVIKESSQGNRALQEYFQQYSPAAVVADYNKYWEGLVEQHINTALTRTKAAQERGPGVIDTVYVATGSSTKRSIITEVATAFNMPITFIPVTGEQERTWSEQLRKDGIEAADYGMRLALEKAGVADTNYQQTRPLLGMDTIVIDAQGVIREKPRKEDNLSEQLLQLSDTEIQVATLMGLKLTLASGHRLYLSDGVKLTLALRSLSQTDVDNYIAQAGETAFAIAGGIDFASPAGRSLLDKNKPVRVSSVFPDLQEKRGELHVGFPAIHTLDTYFKGAPIHLLRYLLQNIQPIYDLTNQG